jgi:pyrroline-5-carboxylate reductase
MTTYAFIGAGKMGEAILKGLLNKEYLAASEVIMSDVSHERLHEMSERYKVRVVNNNRAAVEDASIILLAVKPQSHAIVLPEIADLLDEETVLISIAMGKSTESIEVYLNGPVQVVRVMPNTPALVSASISSISYGESVTSNTKVIVREMFSVMGEVIEVEEKLQDEVGAISSCGPAYFYLMIDALADAGVRIGLERSLATRIATETMIGSGMMLRETGLHPAQLRDMVTSPGGTTIAALEVLEEHAFRAAIIKAVQASIKRAREM